MMIFHSFLFSLPLLVSGFSAAPKIIGLSVKNRSLSAFDFFMPVCHARIYQNPFVWIASRFTHRFNNDVLTS